MDPAPFPPTVDWLKCPTSNFLPPKHLHSHSSFLLNVVTFESKDPSLAITSKSYHCLKTITSRVSLLSHVVLKSPTCHHLDQINPLIIVASKWRSPPRSALKKRSHCPDLNLDIPLFLWPCSKIFALSIDSPIKDRPLSIVPSVGFLSLYDNLFLKLAQEGKTKGTKMSWTLDERLAETCFSHFIFLAIFSHFIYHLIDLHLIAFTINFGCDLFFF